MLPAITSVRFESSAGTWLSQGIHASLMSFTPIQSSAALLMSQSIPVGCFVHRWYALEIERPALKNLRAWYDRLATRPAYAKHIMVKLT